MDGKNLWLDVLKWDTFLFGPRNGRGLAVGSQGRHVRVENVYDIEELYKEQINTKTNTRKVCIYHWFWCSSLFLSEGADYNEREKYAEGWADSSQCITGQNVFSSSLLLRLSVTGLWTSACIAYRNISTALAWASPSWTFLPCKEYNVRSRREDKTGPGQLQVIVWGFVVEYRSPLVHPTPGAPRTQPCLPCSAGLEHVCNTRNYDDVPFLVYHVYCDQWSECVCGIRNTATLILRNVVLVSYLSYSIISYLW